MLQSFKKNNQKKMIMVLSVGHGFYLRSRVGITAIIEPNSDAHSTPPHNIRTSYNILQIANNYQHLSTCIHLLQDCIKKNILSEGRAIHAHMNKKGFMADRFLGNTVMNMYVKCGSLVDARRVFNQMTERDVCSWTIMISGYSKHGFPEEVLVLFYQMQLAGLLPNHFTFAGVLTACTDLASVEKGMDIHEQIIRSGFECNAFLTNAIIDMYVKCGSLEFARNAFDRMPKPDVISWTAMIAGYAQTGEEEEALELYEQMRLAGVDPDSKTFSIVVSACANLAALEQGMKIHDEIVRNGFQYDLFVASALVNMYAKCGNIEKARQIFDAMNQQDTPSWTVMISGYARDGQGEEALKLFQQMQQVGVKASSRTYASVLSACANLVSLKQGGEIHEKIITNGFHSDVIALSSLIGMYAKCGSMQKARELFDKMHHRDVVSWTTIVTGYLQNGCVDEALKLFQSMPQKDVFSWTAMIAGYAQNGRAEDALNLFQQMNLAGVRPNSKTFASILPVCANLAALEHGMEIHEDIIRSGLECDLIVENALIDMYAKCGMLDKAYKLFDRMHQRDVVSWTTMIAGYAIHSYGKEALELFEQMKYSGISPDHVTLVCVLSACCHAGLVEEGYHYFNLLSEDYHITPTMDHYRCMVDLLCRAGRLDEAQTFINKMPIKPDVEILISLLCVCKIHNKIELAESAAEHIFELDPENAAPYVLLSNMYATAGRWEDSEKVRKMMKDRGVKKTPGCSWIEINKQLHTFLVEDRSFTTQEIDAMS